MGSSLNCEFKHQTSTPVEDLNETNKRPTSPSQVQPTVGQASNKDEICQNKEKWYKEQVKKLEYRICHLDELIEGNDQQMEDEKRKHEMECKQYDDTLSREREKNRVLKEENEKLLLRLSAAASAKLTDGNANIADLSDENRPLKLAERYSELYDNEWTDAFDVLQGIVTEEMACRILLELFCTIYRTCIYKANDELNKAKDAIKIFLGGSNQEPPTEVMKQLKDQRKKNSAGKARALKKESKNEIKQILQNKELRKDEKVKRFLNSSIMLCWHMAIQDPHVFVDVDIEGYDKLFDSNVMRAYTKSGNYIDFIVWPPLYLHRGGNLLCKGVAQCTDDSHKRSKPPSDEDKNDIRENYQQGSQPIPPHDAITENGLVPIENNEILEKDISLTRFENKEDLKGSKRKRDSLLSKLSENDDKKKQRSINMLFDQTKVNKASTLPASARTVQETKESLTNETGAFVPANTTRENPKTFVGTTFVNASCERDGNQMDTPLKTITIKQAEQNTIAIDDHDSKM